MTNIIKALNKAYEDCGYIQKKGHNQMQNYNYAGEEQFIKDVRPSMIKNGIIISPNDVEILSTDSVPTKSGGQMQRIIIKATYKVLHISGEEIFIIALGEGADTGDKAIYKAETGAYKYAIKQLFMIATGNDPEADEKVDSEISNTAKATTATPTQQSEEHTAKQLGYSVPYNFTCDTCGKEQLNIKTYMRDGARYTTCYNCNNPNK